MSRTVTLAFSSAFDTVGLVAAAIGAISKAAGASADLGDEIELLTVEALNNVVEHAYRGREQQPVRVAVEITDSEVRIEIADQGTPMDPSILSDARWPDIDPDDILNLPEGGFGLALLRMRANELSYASAGGWNVLRLCMRFDPTPRDPR